MSWTPCPPPQDEDTPALPAVDMAIIPRTSDIGGFEVRRALPFRNRRMVGPFIFWDQMGPGEFLTGQGLDVAPHPHIGLSTVTYLIEGAIDHRDSLGSCQRITPGDINLMTAGSGIAHSERTGADLRLSPSRIFGIQSWLALPQALEESAPAFRHTAREDLPAFEAEGVTARLILGDYEGLSSPVKAGWDALYLDARLQAGARLRLPAAAQERAVYILSGDVAIGGISYPSGQMLVLHPGDDLTLEARGQAHVMLLGGAPMDGPRYIYWNFVSSSKDRLEQAKADWKEGRFAKVPGDEHDFVPLPE